MMMNWSALKHMAQSPWHYQQYLKHGITETPAIRRGALVDYILFDRHDEYAVFHGARRAGKVWKDFEATHADLPIFTQTEFDAAIEIVRSIEANPVAREILATTEWQVPLEWKFGDVECRTGGLDMYGHGILADLKVSMTANPDRFKWHCRKMAWHAQLAFYNDGLVAAGHEEPSKVALVAVEPKPHPVCTVFWLQENVIEAGRKLYKSCLERLAVCEKTNHWPAYGHEAELVFDEFDDEPLVLTIGGTEVEV